MPLRLLVPPRTRQRGMRWVRPAVPDCGVETYCQSTSAPPASRRRTETAGSDESRLVSAQPAEPAPTTTKSYRSAVIALSSRLRSEVPDLAQLARIDDSVVAIVHQRIHQLPPTPVNVRIPETSPCPGVVDPRV